MIDDLGKLASGTTLETDVCIIGAGIAGLTVAREFLNTKIQVIMLESGGATGDEGANLLNDGDNAGLPYFSTTLGRTRGFGGTSELWAGQCTPMDECDFETRPWVPHSGWPIGRAELEPYYRRANEVFDLPQDIFDGERTRRFSIGNLGLSPPKLVPHFSVFSPRRYLGREMWVQLQNSKNVSVLLKATVIELKSTTNSGSVERVEARSLAGHQVSIRARAFVLCCGAIENARLLLVSNKREACGLGNRRDLVGRFLQDHVIGTCATMRSENVADLCRKTDLMRTGRFRWSQKLRLADSQQSSAQVLNATASIVYDYEDSEVVERIVRLYRAVARRAYSEARGADLWYVAQNPLQVLNFGARHLGYAVPAIVKPRRVRLSCISEQAPTPASRVALSRETDPFGVQRARVDWQVTDLERRTFQTLTKVCAAEFARIGLAQLAMADWLDETSEQWTSNIRDILHSAGTTRMAADSASGVVDTKCRVFDVENLFVASSSVFPTSGHANPVLSMAALSIRLADHLKKLLTRVQAATPVAVRSAVV